MPLVPDTLSYLMYEASATKQTGATPALPQCTAALLLIASCCSFAAKHKGFIHSHAAQLLPQSRLQLESLDQDIHASKHILLLLFDYQLVIMYVAYLQHALSCTML